MQQGFRPPLRAVEWRGRSFSERSGPHRLGARCCAQAREDGKGTAPRPQLMKRLASRRRYAAPYAPTTSADLYAASARRVDPRNRTSAATDATPTGIAARISGRHMDGSSARAARTTRRNMSAAEAASASEVPRRKTTATATMPCPASSSVMPASAVSRRCGTSTARRERGARTPGRPRSTFSQQLGNCAQTEQKRDERRMRGRDNGQDGE